MDKLLSISQHAFLTDMKSTLKAFVGGYWTGKSVMFVYNCYYRALYLYKTYRIKTAFIISLPTEEMEHDIFYPTLDFICSWANLRWHYLSRQFKEIIITDVIGFKVCIMLRTSLNFLSRRGGKAPPGYVLAGGGMDQAELLKNKHAFSQFLAMSREIEAPQVWICANPPLLGMQKAGTGTANPDWIYEIIDSDKNYKLYEASTLDANFIKPESKKIEYIDRMRNILSPDYFKALILGQRLPASSRNLIWAFNDNHILESPPFNLRNADFFEVHDFNVDCSAVLHCFYDAYSNKLWVENEYIFQVPTLKLEHDLAKIINRQFPWVNTINLDGDATGANRHTSAHNPVNPQEFFTDYEQIIKILEGYNFSVFPKFAKYNRYVESNALLLNNAMSLDKIFIKKTCKHLLSDIKNMPRKSIERNRWKELNPFMSHFLECLLYVGYKLFPIYELDIKQRKDYYTTEGQACNI